MTENKNAVLGTAKKPYEKPEIEVINLDAQPQLLAQSAGFNSIDREYDE